MWDLAKIGGIPPIWWISGYPPDPGPGRARGRAGAGPVAYGYLEGFL